MNPPSGNPISNKTGWKRLYGSQPVDLYCWFVLRAQQLLTSNGLLGSITSSSFKTYVDYEKFRQTFMTGSLLSTFVDLGWGVLDQAYVGACCYTMQSGKDVGEFVPFFDVTDENDKAQPLFQFVQNGSSTKVWWRIPSSFRVMEGSPLIYWWSPERLKFFSSLSTVGSLCEAIGKGAGPHAIFYRLRWEIPPEGLGLGKKWATFVNGGAYSPFRRDDRLLLDWESNGRRVKEYILMKYPYLNGNTEWNIQLEKFYGRSGITYGKKTTNFSAQPLPAGSIFSFEGIGMFPLNHDDSPWLLSYLNSSFASWFLNATCGLHKNPPYLRRLPVPNFTDSQIATLRNLFNKGWRAQAMKSTHDETSPIFVSVLFSQSEVKQPENPAGSITSVLADIDSLILPVLGLSESDIRNVDV